MNIYEKLCEVQRELKAPKNQFNKFGNYKYRSLEDISEAAKPLLCKHGLTLTMGDKPVMIGDRIYIESTATLTDNENPESQIVEKAYAREAATKKGMDDSQITGSTSSYARKYCLNGLFCIDDTKDADSMDNRNHKQTRPPKNQPQNLFLTEMKKLAGQNKDKYFRVLGSHGFERASDVTETKTQQAILTELRRA